MKFLIRVISLILVGALAITTLPANTIAANPVDPIETQWIDVGGGMDVSIEESNEERIVVYYENNIPLQKAVLDKETGDIFYYDLTLQSNMSRTYSDNIDTSTLSHTEKYNIEDFIVANETVSEISTIASSSTPNFNYIKSKNYDDSGIRYERHLSGYKDESQYNPSKWAFEINSAFSVVITVLGSIPEIGEKIKAVIGAVGIVGGMILSKLLVDEWIKERFWKYQFKQVKPKEIQFICYNRFIYEKQRRVEINGDEGRWETFYTESELSIQCTRDDILTYPTLYF